MDTQHIQATLQLLHQLSQLDMGDAQLQHAQQENQYYPQGQQVDNAYKGATTQHVQAQTAQLQDEMTPESKSRHDMVQGASAMGALGHGLAYQPDMANELMPQMAQKLLGYVPDPQAAMKQTMMKHGLNPNNPQHVAQFQKLVTSLGH